MVKVAKFQNIFSISSHLHIDERNYSKIKKVNGHIFFFGEMGQNYGAKSLVFVSSCSLKTRELSFAQFVYFLRKVCLFFNFWMIKFIIILNKTKLWISSLQNWKLNILSSKSIQTEKSHILLFWGNKRQQKPDISHLEEYRRMEKSAEERRRVQKSAEKRRKAQKRTEKHRRIEKSIEERRQMQTNTKGSRKMQMYALKGK